MSFKITAAVSIALLSVAASIGSAQADSPATGAALANYTIAAPTEGVSTTTSTELGGSSILDSLYVNYFGIFHGMPVKSMSSSFTVDPKGVPSARNAINFDSEITTAYMFNKNVGVGPVIPFLLVPVMGQGVILGDLGIKAFDKKTMSYRGFDLYTNLIVQAPTSGGSQARNMTFAIKMTPYARYSIPQSRFTVGAWTEQKVYFGVTTDKSFKLYGAPYVNYRLTPTLSLNLEYELEAHHNVGDQGVNFTMYQTDVEPGLVWMITPKVMFNPYLQVFTTSQVSTDNMAVGAVISATVL